MSWDQDYSVPSDLDLYIKLTGVEPEYLMMKELEKQGVKVVKTERVLLDEGYFQDVYGTKVTLSDGRVFVPKLTQKFTENGNHGIDVYEYFLENETPVVRHIDGDTRDENVDVFNIPEREEDIDMLPVTDEAPLESDGVLEGEEDLRDQSY